MKKLIYGFGVILLTGFFSVHCYAEKPAETHVEHRQERLVISPSLPDYIFEFNFDEDNRSGLTSDKPILVRKDGNPAVIQILKSTDDGPYEWNSGMGVNAELDLNRDGYKDLAFGTGSGGRTKADYYLFNPKTGRFDFLGNYPELYLEPKTKRIFSYGGNASYRYYYKIINGRLTNTMMIEIEYKIDEKTGVETYVRVTKEKKHGKWKVIKREIIKEGEDEF